ncbi:MAG: ribonuclease HII [Deferrisomatales bacterium]|nr:ribonuclease HII [Deferrisomatales bacterium]
MGCASRRLGRPDQEAHARGYLRVCGLDEVGRGPLAGPVVAAAVVLSPGTEIPGLDDSKRLGPAARARLEPAIRSAAVDFALAVASPAEIDALNILQASLLAMGRAVAGLSEPPDFLLVDGNRPVPSPLPQRTVVGGDGLSTAIAAASVLAKQYRDALMEEYGRVHPGYGFEIHRGYPTPEHREALRRLGPCPLHRRSFRGVCTPSPPLSQLDLFPPGNL